MRFMPMYFQRVLIPRRHILRLPKHMAPFSVNMKRRYGPKSPPSGLT